MIYSNITADELRLVENHLNAALASLELAQHCAGSNPRLATEIELDVQAVARQLYEVHQNRLGRAGAPGSR